jgi:hypothetical protein
MMMECVWGLKVGGGQVLDSPGGGIRYAQSYPDLPTTEGQSARSDPATTIRKLIPDRLERADPESIEQADRDARRRYCTRTQSDPRIPQPSKVCAVTKMRT